jgi:quercetin dioxygenase-like cupin family protein
MLWSTSLPDAEVRMMLTAAKRARRLWVLGELLEVRVTAAETGGAYGVIVDRGSPGFGPPPHIHHREDEGFYVVEGTYEFDLDGEVFQAEPGDFVHAPRGRRHSYRNVGESAGELLTLYAPGGLEGLFLEVGVPVTDPAQRPKGPPDPSRLLERAPDYGLEFLVPGAGH